MGIETRIETSKFLMQHGKNADALILTLIAVASSARKQYPTDNDNQSFKKFLARRLNEIISNGHDSRESFGGEIEFDSTHVPGKSRLIHSVEELIYEQYRCNFIHEAELPKEVQFTDTPPTSNFKEQTTFQIKNTAGNNITITVLQDNTLVLNYAWLNVLIAVVEGASINEDIYGAKLPIIDDGEEGLYIVSIKSS
jgi:hypothetical protein